MRQTLIRAALAIPLVLFAGGPAASVAGEFSEAQQAEIKALIAEAIRENPDIIAGYLRENPEILVEVIELLNESLLDQLLDKLVLQPLTPITGNPDGDVTVIEFFDYQCPYCKKTFTLMTELEHEDKNLRVVWKEYPILGPVSRFASRAAVAADRQGKYMEFHAAVMGAPGRLSEARVLELAKGAGIDIEQLEKDMKAPEIDAYLDETIRHAEALGITGTPGFAIGRQIVSGAISKADMLEIIESERQNAK